MLGCELGCRLGQEVTVGYVGETISKGKEVSRASSPSTATKKSREDRRWHVRVASCRRAKPVAPVAQACLSEEVGESRKKDCRSPDGDVAVEKGRGGLKGVDSEGHVDGGP